MSPERYAAPSWAYGRLLCRECSTRTLAVMIPADERADHDAWHDGATTPAPTRGPLSRRPL